MILSNISNDEIIKTIYKRYSIRHTKNDINSYRNKIEKDINYEDKIIYILKKLSIPLTIKDIEHFLSNDYGKILPHSTLLTLMFDKVCKNGKVFYNRSEKTFSVNSNKNIDFSQENDNSENSTLEGDKTYENEEINNPPFNSYNEVLIHEIETLKKQSNNFNLIESSVISKILDKSIAIVYISSISTNNDNNYLKKLCSIYIVFLENLLIVLEYFKNSEFDITRNNLNNYILSKNINIADFDVFNLITNHIGFAVQRESIYFKVTDKRILNDFIDDVSNELFFYKEYLQSITKEDKTNNTDTFFENIGTKDLSGGNNDLITDEETISVSSSNNEEISEDIYETKVSEINKSSIVIENVYDELIEIKKNLQINIDRINLLINKKQNSKELVIKNEWIIISDCNIKKNIQINFKEKKLTFKNINNLNFENLFKEFLLNISKQRNLNRNFEVDLFFENLEEFYTNDYDL
ncbi:hypothetical protein CLV55_10325 [Flavobacterium aciduliphilum]|uniref:Uncharacterized protein n=2 Tax=Flavobacterium aciduliphilum TaxID=1101402 RepID=A0A328YUG3_9FLAO|nr:hypothetical protein CLV55_10325 [Flavobacterium aciduliphilum]